MFLPAQNLKIFPNATSGLQINDIQYYLTSLLGDGVVRGFDATIIGGAIVLTPGIAIVDGVVIEYTLPLTLPYSISSDKDVVLVNKFSDTVTQEPEVRENYSGEKPFIYLYSLIGGVISYSKRQWSVASKDARAFGFQAGGRAFLPLINKSNADAFHKHTGIYRMSVTELIVQDNEIVSIPQNAVTTLVTIHSMAMVTGSTMHCFIMADGRVRCYADMNGAVVARGHASVKIISATYGSSGE